MFQEDKYLVATKTKQNKPIKLKKARFIKVDIKVSDEPLANKILKVFTFIPFPLFIGKVGIGFFVNKINKELNSNLSRKDLVRLLNASKGLTVDVEAEGATVYVRII